MIYRVWDTDINRLHGTYDNEADALALVRTLVSAYGNDYATELAVGSEAADGSFTEPLSGAALIARAEEVAAERDRALSQKAEFVGSGRGPSRSGSGLPVAAASRGRAQRNVHKPTDERGRRG